MDNTHAFMPICSSECLENVQSNNHFLDRNMLNSERIKASFGSYDLEIIQQNRNTRIANLFSCQPNTTRTLSVVNFINENNKIWHKEHCKISDGQSIGHVFKDNHWKISKYSKFFGQLAHHKSLPFVYEKMRIKPRNLCLHIYELWVQKKTDEMQYATITELHHPLYLKLGDLKTIYADSFDEHLSMCEQTAKIWQNIWHTLKKLS